VNRRIVNAQRRLVEIGRIRIGNQVETTRQDGTKFKRANRLETFRFTSRDELRLGQVAQAYGGDVHPWDDHRGQWEVYTQAFRLPIVLLCGHTYSQSYEMWGQPKKRGPVVCLRRCDGVTEELSDSPCLCPDDELERAQLAADGKACKLKTRVNVILADVPGVGCWRLDTDGWYAAGELAGMLDLIDGLGQPGELYPATLRLEWRERKKENATLVFPVPVVDLDVKVSELAPIRPLRELGVGGPSSAQQDERRELGPGPDAQAAETSPVAAAARLAESAQHARELRDAPRHKKTPPLPSQWTPDMGKGAVGAPPEEETTGDDEPVAYLNDAQRRLLHAKKKELGLDDDELKTLIEERTGQRSTTKVPATLLDQLFADMRDASDAKAKAAAEADAQERATLL
jgi:hypothetical protein